MYLYNIDIYIYFYYFFNKSHHLNSENSSYFYGGVLAKPSLNPPQS